jgi:outer membrane protein assembly factor BamA
MVIAPGFLGNRDMSYGKLAITHRQYFTLIERDLNFAYRLSYQGRLFGDIPFYMLPFIFNSPPNYTRDGLGGGKTLRGVLRNRVVGEGYFYGNIELRWKFVHTRFLGQNFHIALSTFLDAGMVVGEYNVDLTKVPETFYINDKQYSRSDFFNEGNDNLHFGAGGGIHFVLNENFIVAVDYGLTFRPEDDGRSGLYIGLNWLY